MLTFKDSIQLASVGENHWSGVVDPAYRGFGTQFGGWTGAVLLKSVMVESEARGAPLSLSVLLIEAVAEAPFEIATRLIRSGARLQFWRSEMIQNGKTCAHAQVTLGVRRETTRFTDSVMPEAPSPDAPGLRRFAPPAAFAEQHDMRWITPPPRASDVDFSKPASSLVWIRDKAERPLDVLMLANMADLAPPRVLWKRDGLVQSSTVSMTTHFHATPEEIAATGSRHLLSEVHCRRCEGGYFDHELKLWSPDGALLATSEQVAAFRD